MDVWGVGMLAWQLLTGGPAFDAEEDDEEDVRPPAAAYCCSPHTAGFCKLKGED
jgi:hypothetical protein